MCIVNKKEENDLIRPANPSSSNTSLPCSSYLNLQPRAKPWDPGRASDASGLGENPLPHLPSACQVL